jgi:hypothetical protein
LTAPSLHGEIKQTFAVFTPFLKARSEVVVRKGD